MADPHLSVVLALVKVVVPILTYLKKWWDDNRTINPTDIIASLPFPSEIQLVFLNKRRSALLDSSESEVIILTVMGLYKDALAYINKHTKIPLSLRVDINNTLSMFLSKLETIRGDLSGQSSSHENEDKEVRSCLSYLSVFPKFSVFNRKRIIRILVVHNFLRNERGDATVLKQLAKSLEMVESSWSGEGQPTGLEQPANMAESSRDGSGVRHHFRIGNNVRSVQSDKRWTELVCFGGIINGQLEKKCICPRFVVIDASGPTNLETPQQIPKEVENQLYSLIYLGRKEATFDLIIAPQFLFLTVLSLRNVKLENENHLKELSLLRYLDLKYSNVRYVHWLQYLEDLEMLDLRHTNVKQISCECLKKLGKLQCVLLGYIPRGGATRLTGVKLLNPEKLNTSNLKTLRMIRRPDEMPPNLDKVADLSVTGLSRQEMKEFWKVVKVLKHLTSLGVVLEGEAKGRTVELKHCKPELMPKLQRLLLEGEFILDSGSSVLQKKKDIGSSSTPDQPHLGGLGKLPDFESLVDLTLASPNTIVIEGIPHLPKLLCLRLYGVRKDTTMKIEGEGIKKMTNLKKLVIGDMEKVEMIEIGRDIFQRLAALKLCNLPNFQKLLFLGSQHPFLRVDTSNEKKRIEERFQQVDKPVKPIIFLKGFQNIGRVRRSPGIVIYTYDMNKQCYQKRD